MNETTTPQPEKSELLKLAEEAASLKEQIDALDIAIEEAKSDGDFDRELSLERLKNAALKACNLTLKKLIEELEELNAKEGIQAKPTAVIVRLPSRILKPAERIEALAKAA